MVEERFTLELFNLLFKPKCSTKYLHFGVKILHCSLFCVYFFHHLELIYFISQVLSRAFRNRFVELHFDELPSQELEVILHQRCRLPLSYAKKLVAIMLALQVCEPLNIVIKTGDI